MRKPKTKSSDLYRDAEGAWGPVPGERLGTTGIHASVKKLARLSSARPLGELTFTWVVIVLTIGAYLRHPTPWMLSIAFALVASRQYDRAQREDEL